MTKIKKRIKAKTYSKVDNLLILGCGKKIKQAYILWLWCNIRATKKDKHDDKTGVVLSGDVLSYSEVAADITQHGYAVGRRTIRRWHHILANSKLIITEQQKKGQGFIWKVPNCIKTFGDNFELLSSGPQTSPAQSKSNWAPSHENTWASAAPGLKKEVKEFSLELINQARDIKDFPSLKARDKESLAILMASYSRAQIQSRWTRFLERDEPFKDLKQPIVTLAAHWDQYDALEMSEVRDRVKAKYPAWDESKIARSWKFAIEDVRSAILEDARDAQERQGGEKETANVGAA